MYHVRLAKSANHRPIMSIVNASVSPTKSIALDDQAAFQDLIGIANTGEIKP